MKAIVAVGLNGIIGNENSIPWKLPEDLAEFKHRTLFSNLIMGRKTFTSLPAPLKHRNSLVLTRHSTLLARDPIYNDWETGEGSDMTKYISQSEAEQINKDYPDKTWLIGGEEVYRLFAHLVNELYVTVVFNNFTGDVKFPWDCYTDFELDGCSGAHMSKTNLTFTFLKYKRKQK